jgi:hypothetical protein
VPQVCPKAGTASVFVSSQPLQANVLIPSFSQVGCVVTVPAFQTCVCLEEEGVTEVAGFEEPPALVLVTGGVHAVIINDASTANAVKNFFFIAFCISFRWLL